MVSFPKFLLQDLEREASKDNSQQLQWSFYWKLFSKKYAVNSRGRKETRKMGLPNLKYTSLNIPLFSHILSVFKNLTVVRYILYVH